MLKKLSSGATVCHPSSLNPIHVNNTNLPPFPTRRWLQPPRQPRPLGLLRGHQRRHRPRRCRSLLRLHSRTIRALSPATNPGRGAPAPSHQRPRPQAREYHNRRRLRRRQSRPRHLFPPLPPASCHRRARTQRPTPRRGAVRAVDEFRQ